jgi:hypothetical protein
MLNNTQPAERRCQYAGSLRVTTSGFVSLTRQRCVQYSYFPCEGCRPLRLLVERGQESVYKCLTAAADCAAVMDPQQCSLTSQLQR